MTTQASSSRRRRGFTLVEVLLSLALLAMLLLGLNQFIFSMGELWGQNRQQRLFDQHVRAVTRYVGELMQRGTLAPEAGRRLRIAAGRTPGAGNALLTFDLPGDRLLAWPARPLPDVECAINAVAGQGLLLYWQSRWELDFERTPPRVTVISPLVARLEYEYYQPETQSWQSLAAPVESDRERRVLPTRLRLHFQYNRFAADEVVSVPPAMPALPVF
jgi:prepilin-type N-terminal cleavage/methylation domain-containing protein